ncbi:class I SAM-dependent methyltransferase [Fangia hongkongensis]|uniref:class I SAM-dependent methyltransferase n=1 Tax=Fangia hongkongensis TaxID=270495 RepID=UPI0003666C49|nr:class I SAM-dependent methyltransferase [Fangia hongkongensis]MBK2126234.1 class I SAM-dependent methyltransferase [Fangia hongkongensis]
MSNFDLIAKSYEKNAITQSKAAIRTLNYLRHYLKSTDCVLDIGSGSGQITYEISKLTKGMVTGIDISKEMIAASKANYAATNLAYVQQGAEALGETQKYNIIFSNSAFYYLKNRQLCYQKMHAALKPNGYLIAQIMYRDMFTPQLMQALEAIISEDNEIASLISTFNNPIYLYSDKESFLLELTLAGFEHIESYEEEQVTTLDLHQAFSQYESNFLVSLFNPCCYSDPERVSSSYIKKLRDKIKEKLALQLDHNNQIHITMPRMYVVVQK